MQFFVIFHISSLIFTGSYLKLLQLFIQMVCFGGNSARSPAKFMLWFWQGCYSQYDFILFFRQP